VTETCDHCGFKHQLGGPIWTAPMIDPDFVTAVMDQVKDHPQDFASEKRLYGLLSVLREELQVRSRVYVWMDICICRMYCMCEHMMMASIAGPPLVSRLHRHGRCHQRLVPSQDGFRVSLWPLHACAQA
jgi:tRNA G26 N,N-dimethylase Trm1